MKPRNAVIASAVMVVTAGVVFADQPRADGNPMVIATAHDIMADGEIHKVDAAAKKVTIKHGELKNLDMPPMTMVFQVKDPAMLDKVKAGDKVKFRADKINGAFTVVDIETVK